jgi:hypothetical protein
MKDTNQVRQIHAGHRRVALLHAMRLVLLFAGIEGAVKRSQDTTSYLDLVDSIGFGVSPRKRDPMEKSMSGSSGVFVCRIAWKAA